MDLKNVIERRWDSKRAAGSKEELLNLKRIS
jgi:hypothetical protein